MTRLALGLLLAACSGKAPPPPSTPPDAAAPPTAAPSSAPVLAQTPESLAPGTPTQLAALNAAKVALAEGRDREALARFRVAADGPVTGTSVTAALAVADLAQAEGHPEEAAAVYDKLIVAARFVPEVQFAAGRFYFTQGRLPSARHALESATLLQPDFLPAWQLLGIVQSQSGKPGEAARTLTEYELRLNRQVRFVADMTRSPGDRLATVQLLGTLPDERSIAALVVALRDPEQAVRLAAGECLEEADAPAALEGLADAALKEQDPVMRRAMGEMLVRARLRAHKAAAGPLPALPAPPSAAASALDP